MPFGDTTRLYLFRQGYKNVTYNLVCTFIRRARRVKVIRDGMLFISVN